MDEADRQEFLSMLDDLRQSADEVSRLCLERRYDMRCCPVCDLRLVEIMSVQRYIERWLRGGLPGLRPETVMRAAVARLHEMTKDISHAPVTEE